MCSTASVKDRSAGERGVGGRGASPGANFAPALGILPFAAAGQAAVEREIREILVYAAVITGALFVLFIVILVVRYIAERRVRSTYREAGIRHEDLDRMERTGLLSDEERARVREAVARHAREEAEAALAARAAARKKKTNAGAAEALLAREIPLPETPSPAARPPRASAPSPPGPPPPGPPPAPRPGALDIEALLERGLITREEYERLRGDGEPPEN